MATTVELLAKFRLDNDDGALPYLWLDTEFDEYLDEAQDELCEYVDVIADELTVAYSISDTYITVPDYITRVRSADIVASRRYLTLVNNEEFETNPRNFAEDDYGLAKNTASWKDDTASEPHTLITDMKSNMWRLYPIPTVAGTISYRCFRKAINAPQASTTAVELEVTDRQYQRAILLKVRSLAYEKQDSETYDINQANELEAKFLARVENFDRRLKRSRRRATTTNYGGI